MNGLLKKLGWVMLGTFLGFALAFNFSADAQHSDASPSSLPVDELRTFSEVFGKIKTDYVEPVPDRKLIKEAIIGMVSGLDPHSAYLDQEAYKELQTGTQGEFGGLGLEVTMDDGLVKVVSPIDDSPAAKAGMKPGDLIIKLDGEAVKGMTLNDAVKLMRGKPDTTISLTVLRKDVPKPLVITLTRAIIKMKSVRLEEKDPGYAVMRISQFQERTAEDLAKAFDKFYKDNQGHVKGIVLDLRNNPGGLLNAAVGVSAVFLPKDTLVVYTDGRIPDSKMHLTTLPENYLPGPTEEDFIATLPDAVKKVPLVVLVNGGSASASEIVAGALQDQKRGTIMGVRTFGKGSVQTIFPLGNNTALKLTTARYFTPKGRSIQAKGIDPDLVVPDDANSVEATLGIREADLTGHLANPNDGKAGTPSAASPAPEMATPQLHAGKAGGKSGKPVDVQMDQAISYLKKAQGDTQH